MPYSIVERVYLLLTILDFKHQFTAHTLIRCWSFFKAMVLLFLVFKADKHKREIC